MKQKVRRQKLVSEKIRCGSGIDGRKWDWGGEWHRSWRDLGIDLDLILKGIGSHWGDGSS